MKSLNTPSFTRCGLRNHSCRNCLIIQVNNQEDNLEEQFIVMKG